MIIVLTLLFYFIVIADLHKINPGLTVEVDRIKGLEALQQNATKGVYASCHIMLFADIVDYKTATDKCEKLNIGETSHNLATVNNMNRTEDIKLLLGIAYKSSDQWVWAGLKKVQNNKGNKKSKKYNPNHWKWPDGSTIINFSMWQDKQPDQKKVKNRKQNQIRIDKNGEWQDIWDNKEHPYACDYHGKYIISPTRMFWRAARTACLRAGMILAKVRNAQEVAEMVKAINYFLGPELDDDVWNDKNWVLIGGNDIEREGKWEWADGENIVGLEELPWMEGQPDNARMNPIHRPWTKKRQDVMAISKVGMLDDAFTTATKRAFACQCMETV